MIGMTDDDRVFKALADPTRRFLLDRLFERDGRTLTELESELEMTRFGVMKHLRLLEDAGLVVARRSGPGEAALPQPRADPADPRPVDRQVHGAPGLGARRPQDRTGAERMTVQRRPRRPPRSTASGSRRPRRRSGTRSPSPSGPSATATAGSPTTTCGPAAPFVVHPGERDGRECAGVPDDIIDGEVLEADPPRRLVADLADADGPRHAGRGLHEADLRDRADRRRRPRG